MKPDLEEMLAYTPPTADYLNLSTNENFFINHRLIMKKSLNQIMNHAELNHYGQSHHPELLMKYANYIGAKPEQILPAPGSESLIAVLIQALVETTVVTFDTDFFRYGEVAHVLEKNHVTVPIASGILGLIDMAKTTSNSLIMLSNPNNPLGMVYGEDHLIQLLEETDCYVVIDEAYGEYYGESMVSFLEKYPKLIILRTLSKGWGLAGLRVGFMLANEGLIKYVKAVQGPFTLSDLNGLVASMALDEVDLMKEMVERTKVVRSDFIKFLQDYDVDVLPSEANFVYVKTAFAKEISQRLFEEKIAVTARGDGLRITIGCELDMKRLKACLALCLPK